MSPEDNSQLPAEPVRDAWGADEALQEVAAALQQPACVLRGDGSACYANGAYRALVAVAEEATGFGWLSAFDPDDVCASAFYWRRALRVSERLTLSARLRVEPGTPRAMVSLIAVPSRQVPGCWLVLVGQPEAAATASRPPAADRDAREADRVTDTRLRLALAAGRVGIWEWRIGTDAIYWSPEAFEVVGASERDFQGSLDDFRRLVHPDDSARVWQGVERALTSAGEFDCEFRIRRPDGAERWLHNLAMVERDADGRPLRLVGTVRDITDARDAAARRATSEAAYRELANALPQIVWSCDAEGRVEWLNDVWHRYTGLSATDVNERWTEVVHPDDAAETWARSWRAFAEGTPEQLEYRLRGGDGQYRWYFARLVPIVDSDGRVTRWVAAAVDIDDRRRSEDALRQAQAALRDSERLAHARADELAALMDAVPAAVWIAHDAECRHITGNRAGQAMLRMPAADNLSKTGVDQRPTAHFDLFRDGVRLAPSDLPLQVAAREGIEVREFEEEIRFVDGEVVYIYGTAVPLRDETGKSRGAIGAFVDVSRLKRAEAALRESDRRKDEFLAILSHELRNPLSPILTAAQLMALRGDVATPREREIILRQAQHLLRLVDDLLDVSRVTRKKLVLDRKPVELASLVARAVEATATLFENRRHHLVVDVPHDGLLVDADEVRMCQVIGNVLTNAARYTEAGGHVHVKAAREGTDVVLRVQDDGIGIPPTLLPHIFEMFVQGEQDLHRARGGLGLGLALVRRLTELHGGVVEAHSEGAGRGSVFTLRLPAAAVPHTIAAGTGTLPDGARRRAARPLRVLVVDDNQDAADMLALFIGSAGHEVTVAYDPSSAIAVARRVSPDVAVLDIGLPVMDGYELGAALRAGAAEGTPKLVALTGYGQEHDRRRSEAAGFSHHLVKPVQPDMLLDVLEQLSSG